MITHSCNRRQFLGQAGLALFSASTHSHAFSAVKRPGMKKSLKIGMVHGNQPLLEKFRMLKEIGYDGVELDSPSELNPKEVLRARDAAGLVIPGVVDSVHWKQTLSDPDPAVRARGLEGLKVALRECKLYGGTTVLLVPAVVNKEVSYQEAYDRSQAEIRKVLPLAEELGIKIAIENVWNHFLLSPMEAARYVDELDSPWVGWYFDVGNIVNYGWPEHWIRILNKRILKLDIKEFSRKKRDEAGPRAGFAVNLWEGDCDWPAVMKALDEIGYRGWGSAEMEGGGRERLKDIAERMDRIYAG
ncbi:MAG: sugar phosphate isomerase/epimerase family protein [Acidobacteriota bacterium]